MALWDELAPAARDSGALGAVEDLLRDIGVTTTTDELPGPPPKKRIRGTWSPSGGRPLHLDPATGRFALSSVPSSTSNPRNTPVEFPEPTVDFELLLELDAPGGDPTGPFELSLTIPRAILHAPFLRGARLDPRGMLIEDPANPRVKFTLPRLKIETSWTGPGSGPDTRLASAATAPPAGSDPADIYEFVRMEPPYALVGPGDVVGFAFRTAALDLSGTSNPPGAARAMPLDWQGLWLPEARLFIAPSGMEGLAINGGVRDLWVGFGVHAGITGILEAEVVNRGSNPRIRLRFQDPEGRWYGVLDEAVNVTLPPTSTLYVDAGGGLAPYTYSINVGGTTTSSDRALVAVPATGSVSITVTVTDGASHTSTRTITATRRSVPLPPGGGGGTQPVTPQTTSATGSRIEIVSQTASEVVVRLEPEGGSIAWSWDGGGSATGDTATIPVPAGTSDTTVGVTATRTRPAATPVPLHCYFMIDHPKVEEEGVPPSQFLYSLNPDNTRTGRALSDGSGFPPDTEPFIGRANEQRIKDLPAGTTFSVEGFASYDGDPSLGAAQRNMALSERRRDGLVEILQQMLPSATVSAGTAHGHGLSRSAPGIGRNEFWRATATATPPTPGTEAVTGTLTRPAAPTPPAPADVDPEPTRPPTPDCFRKIGARVEWVRGTFVRAEVYGEFDFRTAAEQRLSASGAGTIPPRTNPSDGICTFLVRLRLDETRSRWDVTAEFRALEADLDGLYKLERSTTGPHTGTNVLGALAVLAPLLATATPPAPTAGELVALSVATGTAIGLGTAGRIETQYLILRGGELMIADSPEGTKVTLLLDVETAFSFDAVLLRVPPNRPVVTRYKAVGLRVAWDQRALPSGGVEHVPLWMFDPSRGYTLDVPAGALVAREPLGDLLRALGFRVSRENPTYLEIEVGIAADLGIVSVDTVRVRLRLDAAETPQITAFGATIDVPGVLHGSGYLSLPPSGGLAGAFDLTIVPLNVRVAAALKIEQKDGVTGAFVGLEVEFPVPIVLGNSGLGIFGVLGAVGANFERAEPANVPAPALRWLEQQMARPLQILNPQGWRAQPGKFAFAAGILLGTLEGGFVVHLKGVVLLELPGPRLLLVMKADVLKLPPALKSTQTATFLAVIDMDFARGTITIGLVAEYSVQPLLYVRVPVTAFFDSNHIPEWFVDLGTFTEPVTVKVFEYFEGTGYLMVHGNGISHPKLPSVATSGLTIAAGFHVQFVWGSTSVGLYLKVAGGFDALVSFKPFSLGGIVEIRGELRLFIVSIGASARLTVLSGRGIVGGVEVERTYIHGEVCGEVDFFFFSVRGCVSMSLGDPNVPDPSPPPLVAGVSLVSRSPALVEGSGTDRAVDGKLGDAREVGDPEGTDPAPVPLDAIPVVLFDVPGVTPSGFTVLGGAPHGTSGVAANPWIRRGRRWWIYEITAVEFVGDLSSGDRPCTWWTRGMPSDPQHGPALALLSWLPEPATRAVPYGERLTTTVTDRWGRVCLPPAEPAPVLWTFNQEPNGPSPDGWVLDGVQWPDPPGTFRSDTQPARLRVTDRWRCGIHEADTLRGIDPARVVGDSVPCPREQPAKEPTLDGWMAGQPTVFSRAAGLDDALALTLLTEFAAKGVPAADLRANWVRSGWEPKMARDPLDCIGRVLQSSLGDGPEPVQDGDPGDEETILKGWEDARFEPGELDDAIRFKAEEGFRALRVLLLVSEQSFNELIVHYLDADDSVLHTQAVTTGEFVGPGTLPGRWTDFGGPWADDIERAGRMAARIASGGGGMFLILLDAEIPDGTTAVEIGFERTGRDHGPQPFYIVALEGLLFSEAWRYDWDSTTIDSNVEALEDALTHDPDDHALLVPDHSYTVRVRWRAASVEQDDRPAASTTPSWGSEETQEFTFLAEGNDRVPARLDPWVLASTPGPDDIGVFCDERVRIAFNSGSVEKLFAAYGQELRLMVRSATGRHPVAAGQTQPGPLVLDFATAAATTGLNVMTPWEEAVRDLIPTLECMPSVGERVDHKVVEVLYALEPSTDYLLDVLRVPQGAAASATGERIFRVGFTTSRFSGLEEFARLTREASIEHRLVANRAPLDALPTRPTGPVLDQAFSDSGLGVPEVPRYPRVQVLWSSDATPQPIAVVVESNEPMWRSRPMPTIVAAPPDATDPTHHWWAARPAKWLALEPAATPPAPGDPPRAMIERLVRGPGDTRAVALLGAGARGQEVRLVLRRKRDPLAGDPDQVTDALRVLLHAAPWEEGA